ncbi:MAG: hypothetical protein HOI39_07730 [Flavobacteriales bacterium]|jgi:hypothetical protein|nr:hypothetical protein [Flavobacteriales bacterium]
MGFFNTVSAASKAAKIANKVGKVSSTFINILITNNIPIKTHDTLKITMLIQSNYNFTAMMLIHSQESNEFKEKLLGLVSHNVSEIAKDFINPAVGDIVEDLHDNFAPNGAYDEVWRLWLTEWNQKYSDLTEVNFEIEENTSTILMDYLDQQFDLSSTQSRDLKTTIFEMLKNESYS